MIASVLAVWEGDATGPACPTWTSLTALAGLDEVALRTSCRRRRYARGEVIFHEGDTAGPLHLLERGCVTVRLTTPMGDVATVDVLQPGDAFGEQSLVDGVGERTATVTALSKVETLTLDRASFAGMRDAHPGVDRFLLMVVTARLRSTSQQLLEALYVNADVRVLRCLCRLSAIFSPLGEEPIRMTQLEIASMTGVDRSTVNRVLANVQRQGVLRLERGRITVLEPTALRRLAQLRPTAASSPA
jgi:CRP/FNR family transcriptional regulator, cyclic AMP receptor protein